MPKSILPREGLTLEALFAPIRLTLLQPLLIGPLLLALNRYPTFAAQWLPPDVFKTLRSDRVLASLSVLFSISLLRKLNSTLSRQVLNNFTTDKTWDWAKEIVVITGGSSGIGAEVVKMLTEKNIKVIILDVVPPKTPITRSNAQFYETDITSSAKIKEVAQKIRKDHGDPTVLINNAGIGLNKTILDETEAELRRVFDVNTISHFLLVQEFLPAMIARNHGHVVTIASMASFVVHAQNVDYTCTKASSLAFHEGLAQELKSRYNANKVRTTIIHPTWIRTPLIAKLIAKPNFDEFVLEPETVAEAIVEQLLSGYGAQIILPARLSPVSLLRGMPSWFQEGMRNAVADVLRL